MALRSIPLQPSTRSFGLVVVRPAVHPATPRCTLLAVVSSGEAEAIPVNEAAAINPLVTAPEKVAVITVPGGKPRGALADATAP